MKLFLIIFLSILSAAVVILLLLSYNEGVDKSSRENERLSEEFSRLNRETK